MLRVAARRLAARLPLGAVLSGAAPLACLGLAGVAALQQQLDAPSSRGTSVSGIDRSFFSRSFGSSSSSSGRAGSGGGSSSGGHAAPPTPAQAAATDRLLELSREQPRKGKSHVSDSELRQRILLLLQRGHSEAAINKHIQRHGGGPYVAWDTFEQMSALLRAEGFSPEQRDSLLVGGGTTGGSAFSRAPADVAANLRWLRDTFGLTRAGAALACVKSPGLLAYKQDTLRANWAAIVDRRQLSNTAMGGVATALRQGKAAFLLHDQQTVRDKEAALQALLGLTNAQLSARYGKLAELFACDVPGLKPRLQLLLELTGLPLQKLAPHIMSCPALLYLKEETLQRNHDAILAAMGDEAAGKLLISRSPIVLASGDERVALNLQTLRRPPFGCSPTAAVDVLVKNARLGYRDLDRPAVAARVAFWQQAYACASPEAALLKCAGVMDQKLTTLAPRALYWRDQHPGSALPAGTSTFSLGDPEFCSKQGFQLAAFQAFKQRWLAGEEGRAVCRHERGSE